jgi:hypothetical protein
VNVRGIDPQKTPFALIVRFANRAFTAATSGPIDDGGNGATLLALISHST